MCRNPVDSWTYSGYHLWFAWHPVLTQDGRRVFWRSVWRRQAYPPEHLSYAEPTWEYFLPQSTQRVR